MAEQKHTPGPWRAMGCEIISDMWVVATVHWHSGNQDQDEANRHVIAAAPDMLAVLNTVRIMLKNRDQDPQEKKLLDVIKVVVAQAEGRA